MLKTATTRLVIFTVGVGLLSGPMAQAQETKRSAGSIQLSFLPPPLEKATYSLGIFEGKTNRLIRHLQESALERDFTVGLNGLITAWDGKDDNGKPVPPGRYAARGYAIGALKIEGEAIYGNDWAADDEDLRFKRVAAIAMVPGDSGLAVLAALPDGTCELARFSAEGKLVWHKTVSDLTADGKPWLDVHDSAISVMPAKPSDGNPVDAVGTFQLADGSLSGLRIREEVKTSALAPLPPGAMLVTPRPPADFAPAIASPELSVRSGVGKAVSGPERQGTPPVTDHWTQRSFGKDGTTWTAAGLGGLVQTARDGTALRKLEVIPGEPLPVAVSAATGEDRLYLLEERNGWQRVRGLSWMETKEENGHPVSTWQTFFERSIRGPDTAAVSSNTAPVEITLAENPLTPGKPQKLRLAAAHDAKGSYLATESGLRLRRVSERASLENVRLARGKTPGSLAFFQYDGAATDEFSIAGARNIMEFDAGEFEMTATGEKPADPKPTEPPDL